MDITPRRKGGVGKKSPLDVKFASKYSSEVSEKFDAHRKAYLDYSKADLITQTLDHAFEEHYANVHSLAFVLLTHIKSCIGDNNDSMPYYFPPEECTSEEKAREVLNWLIELVHEAECNAQSRPT